MVVAAGTVVVLVVKVVTAVVEVVAAAAAIVAVSETATYCPKDQYKAFGQRSFLDQTQPVCLRLLSGTYWQYNYLFLLSSFSRNRFTFKKFF